MCLLLQIANVSSGAGSLAGKVKFVEDAEIRKNLPYATQAMAYKMSKAALNMREHISHPPQRAGCRCLIALCTGPELDDGANLSMAGCNVCVRL